MSDVGTKNKHTFKFDSDVEPVLRFIADESRVDDLLDAIYQRAGNLEDSIVKYLSDCVFPSDVLYAREVVSYLTKNKDGCRSSFLIRLFVLLRDTIDLEQIDPNKKKNLLILINQELFWIMYGISIKKCLGVGHATKQIPNSEFFQVLPDDINSFQQDAHKDTLESFNTDVRRYSFRRTPDLKYFLHPIHSNKSPNTKKKNIHRVEKRAKRIMLLYGLKQNGDMFNQGRHMVPKQFASGIIKIFINTK